MAIYVDDGLVASSSLSSIKALINSLSKSITIREFDTKKFIAFEIERDEKGISLHQQSYINRVLNNFNMADCTPVRSPLADINILNSDDENDQIADVPYQELIGSLLYCSQATRPYICFSVNFLSKFNNKPLTRHWSAAKCILRYLKGTIDFANRYETDAENVVSCFSDSDWAGDVANRRSTSGVVIYSANGPVMYKSKQQSSVALSST